MSTTIIKRSGPTLVVEHLWHTYEWNYDNGPMGSHGAFLGEVTAKNYMEACEKASQTSGKKLIDVFASRKKLHAT